MLKFYYSLKITNAKYKFYNYQKYKIIYIFSIKHTYRLKPKLKIYKYNR